jgi:hypothetical protein
VIAALLLLACATDGAATLSTLHRHGFRDVDPRGYAWGACALDAITATWFVAELDQRSVSGAVCCDAERTCWVVLDGEPS